MGRFQHYLQLSLGDIRKNYKVYLPVLIIKLFFVFLGCTLLGVGISLYFLGGAGASPIAVWVDGLHNLLDISYGQAAMLNSACFFLFLLFFSRKYIWLGSLVSIVWTGLVIDYSFTRLQPFLPASPSLWEGVGIAFLGLLATCLGTGITMAAEQSTDPFVGCILTVSASIHKSQRFVYLASIAILLAAGFCFGGVIGFGTLVGVVGTASLSGGIYRLLQKCTRVLQRPFLKDRAGS